jgi:cancer susceptibility candidate protein 1|mmetsp:Transcript_63933/g.101374  ORF Transcript_63933/g.101374 Transcript_63933/m.101374 type:complete len:646 (-) Transcript_63933:67-2004(-)|eukprot:CAMPEP_0169079508 /NCGR_PEP_ID=MMETSP1015-20121227/9984_1 /TAXON_ID=342587 /ORGANISM="Karlodinium micrum, Strain CCMP2283" /LENGTH=645 /DNA_ID=CAMNT_0009139173 /DNA_START=65 /DNA_END=2002 /DNA_ORIENTATION=-
MGRKGKKTKKALEDELQKQSEDQRRREEEERLQKLEEDCLATHRRRLDDELEAKERVEEAERLEEESSIVNRMKGDRKQNLEYEQQKLQDQINWQKFVSCTSRPNVAFENEITTYMTMVREEKVEEIEDAMRKCRESEEIVGDLMELYCKAREDGDTQQREWCMKYIHEIRALEIEQIDEATAYLLQHIENFESSSHNSQVSLQWGNQNDDIKIGFWGHLVNKGFRQKSIDHPKLQITLEVPKSIAMQGTGSAFGIRTLYTKYDSCHGKDPSHMPVGGMIRVDLLAIPPPSRRVKGWTIRQIPPPGEELHRLSYPNTEHSLTQTYVAQPCKIEYKVPSNVLIRSKSPTVSWWDTVAEKWSQEGIDKEISWDPEGRKINFWSSRLAAFSITQERHLDLPYTYWSLRPVAMRKVELIVQAARFELRFEISEEGLKLKGPELPELQGIMYTEATEDGDAEGKASAAGGKEPRIRSPATLLMELRECGLNLLPEDADADFLPDYTPKNTETQARAYSDLSEIAAFYDIASSKHNRTLDPQRALVRIRENLLFEDHDPLDPDCDCDYQSIIFFPDKACFVQSLEMKTPCQEQMVAGHFTHASLYICFDKHPTLGAAVPETLQRLEVTCTNVRFIESVRQTMALMRLLSFS